MSYLFSGHKVKKSMDNVYCEKNINGMQCTKLKGHEGKHQLPMVHKCHWPTCNEPVPPRLWGCKKHWSELPKHLRDKIWATYKPGQEITKTPSKAYIKVALEIDAWCLLNIES